MSGNMAFEPRLARTNFRSNGSQITTSELDMSLIPTIVIGNDSIDEPPSPRRNLEGDHPYAPNEHREVTGKIKSQLRLSLIRHRDSPPSYSTFGFTHASLVPRTLSNEVIMLLVRENGWCRVGTTTPLQPSDFVPDVNHDYRPTLAILLLIDCEMAIASLIDEQISAAVLPLHAEELENEIHFRRSDPQGRPGAPAELRSLALATSRENFSSRQYKVMAPRFTITKSAGNMFEAEHKIFSQDTILPWCQAMEGDNAARDPGAIESGFAQVRKVRMDPRSHDFDEVIKKLRLKCDGFALKTLKKTNEHADLRLFRNELEQLKRFNAFRHQHLVMLLISFQRGNTYHFVFPYAKCNLSDFWENTPSQDTKSSRWLARQLSGLTEALSFIHNPPWERGKFGRHGDIKAENVLIFEREGREEEGIGGDCIMVLSDLGLTDIHGEFSRSNIPTKNLPVTPTYRAPESDFDGDCINRAYDIWTLGCLFMEAMVWHLGGPDWLQKFDEDRRSLDARKMYTPIYFDIMYTSQDEHSKGDRTYTASVKEKVIEWFNKIRTHDKCTQLVIDIINIVEDDMLIVRTPEKDRITAQELTSRLKSIEARCRGDDYIHGVSQNPRLQLEPVPIRADLKQGIIDEHRSGMLKIPRLPRNKRTFPGLSALELAKP